MEKNQTVANTSDREIRATRILNAPRELVFEVWTDPAHIVKWWGPNGFTNTIHKMDVRPGGTWDFIMHGPDGTDYPNLIKYVEVVKPERLVFDHGSGQENDPAQFHVTVTFEDLGDERTKLTMVMLFKTAADRDFVVTEYGALDGNKQTMDKLEAYLATLD